MVQFWEPGRPDATHLRAQGVAAEAEPRYTRRRGAAAAPATVAAHAALALRNRSLQAAREGIINCTHSMACTWG